MQRRGLRKDRGGDRDKGEREEKQSLQVGTVNMLKGQAPVFPEAPQCGRGASLAGSGLTVTQSLGPGDPSSGLLAAGAFLPERSGQEARPLSL